jgi:hypothetical protein
MFRASGEWSHIVVRQDLAGRDRFVTAHRGRELDPREGTAPQEGTR